VSTRAEAFKEIKALRSAGVIVSMELVKCAFPFLGGKSLGIKAGKSLLKDAEGIRSDSPAKRAAAIRPLLATKAADQTTVSTSGTAGPVNLDEDELVDVLFHVSDDQKSSPVIPMKAPRWADTDIADHIGKAAPTAKGTRLAGTGHMRTAHDPQAFPRSWSLEKILAVLSKLGNEVRDQQFVRDSDEGFKAYGKHEGLTIALYFRPKSGRDVLISAYVANVTSATPVEDRDRDAANKVLATIQQKCAGDKPFEEIFESVFEEGNIFATIATAELIKEALRASGSTEMAAEIRELDQILSLGQTRHPVHQGEIDAHKAPL
jgi:hypothetical protein